MTKPTQLPIPSSYESAFLALAESVIEVERSRQYLNNENAEGGEGAQGHEASSSPSSATKVRVSSLADLQRQVHVLAQAQQGSSSPFKLRPDS